MDIASADGTMTAVGDTFSPSATSWGMYILRRTADGWQSEPAPVDGPASFFSLAPIPGGGTWNSGASGNTDPVLTLNRLEIGARSPCLQVVVVGW